MKKCPYCAEEIQDEAIFCRHCKKDIKPKPNKSEKSDVKLPKILTGFKSGQPPETFRTLRLLFIIIGGGGLIGSVSAFNESSKDIIKIIYSIIFLSVGIMWLYFGIELKRMLAKSQKFIINIVIWSTVMVYIPFVVDVLRGTGDLKMLVWGIFLGALWTRYVIVNIKRLSSERQSKN